MQVAEGSVGAGEAAEVVQVEATEGSVATEAVAADMVATEARAATVGMATEARGVAVHRAAVRLVEEN